MISWFWNDGVFASVIATAFCGIITHIWRKSDQPYGKMILCAIASASLILIKIYLAPTPSPDDAIAKSNKDTREADLAAARADEKRKIFERLANEAESARNEAVNAQKIAEQKRKAADSSLKEATDTNTRQGKPPKTPGPTAQTAEPIDQGPLIRFDFGKKQ